MRSGVQTSEYEIAPEPGEAAAGPSAQREFTVMVIDDSKTIRRSAESILRQQGFEVVTAVDGFEALGMIADHEPGLIFLDVMMPRLDGYQTCALIKHHPVFRHTPVVMLSSKDGLFDRARGRVVGAEHFITKPFKREELLAVIERYGDGSD